MYRGSRVGELREIPLSLVSVWNPVLLSCDYRRCRRRIDWTSVADKRSPRPVSDNGCAAPIKVSRSFSDNCFIRYFVGAYVARSADFVVQTNFISHNAHPLVTAAVVLSLLLIGARRQPNRIRTLHGQDGLVYVEQQQVSYKNTNVIILHWTRFVKPRDRCIVVTSDVWPQAVPIPPSIFDAYNPNVCILL